MRRFIMFLLTAVIAIGLLAGQSEAKTTQTFWTNYGYCADSDVWDANAIKDSNASWAKLITNFTTLSDPNNHILRISVPEGFDYGAIRFRCSAVNTSGTVEVLRGVLSGDAEYLFDLTLTADASSMVATPIHDGNDPSGTIRSGGYYFGNVSDSNSASGLITTLKKANCDTSHRGCVLSWYLAGATQIIVHPKSVSNGTIYWDAYFWRDEPR